MQTPRLQIPPGSRCHNFITVRNDGSQFFDPTRHLIVAPTREVDVADVLEQHRAVDGVHLGAEADFSGTQVLVHVVQRVSHGVHGIDHELDLALLLVGRVLADPLVVCGGNIDSVFGLIQPNLET